MSGTHLNRRDFLKGLLRGGAGLGLAVLGLRGLPGCGGPAGTAAVARWTPTAPPPSHELRFYRQLAEAAVHCRICFRNCVIQPGKLGDCYNVKNVEGRAYSLVHSLPCVLQADPIEKEPVFHMLPGTTTYCVGTASCNLRCKNCQNWEFTQRTLWEVQNLAASPTEVVRMAREAGCQAVSCTYNDPIAFYDYTLDIMEEARQAGLRTLCHTNGSLNEEPLETLLSLLDAIVVDLKGFSEAFYERVCEGRLTPVLRALERIGQAGTHLEIVHLVIPTWNDDPADTRAMCRWIVENLGPDVPLHFLRFFPTYRFQRLQATPMETLEQAVEIAQEAGIRYVYIGNVPGHARNSTYCPSCGRLIVERLHFAVNTVEVMEGKCRFCGQAIPGIW